MQTEETPRQTLLRLRARAAALGIGQSAASARRAAQIAKQRKPCRGRFKPDPDAPKSAAGRPGHRVLCTTTGVEYRSIRAAAGAVGGSDGALHEALRRGKGKATWKGQRYEFVTEELTTDKHR